LKKKKIGKPVRCIEASCKAHRYKILVARKMQHKFVRTPSVCRTVAVWGKAQLPYRDNIQCRSQNPLQIQGTFSQKTNSGICLHEDNFTRMEIYTVNSWWTQLQLFRKRTHSAQIARSI